MHFSFCMCFPTCRVFPTCGARNMMVGMSSKLLKSFQGVSPQGGSRLGAGHPLSDTFRPSLTSISKYDDTWEIRKIQSSRQETSQSPLSEEGTSLITNTYPSINSPSNRITCGFQFWTHLFCHEFDTWRGITHSLWFPASQTPSLYQDLNYRWNEVF